MKRLIKNLVVLSLILTGGCTQVWHRLMPEEEARPQPMTAMQPHESWCYTTLGQIDCYPGPQRSLAPESLVSVDPPSRYPLTRDAYAKAVNDYELLGKK